MFARSLKSTFTAGLLATTLALTSVAPNSAAARMSDEEIVGLLGLLAIGAVIHNRRSNNDAAPAPAPSRRETTTRGWRVLPADCIRNVTRRNGNTVRMFGQRCLNNNYAHVNRLPQACHVNLRTENGQRRQGYRVRCLRNQGFRTNRH